MLNKNICMLSKQNGSNCSIVVAESLRKRDNTYSCYTVKLGFEKHVITSPAATCRRHENVVPLPRIYGSMDLLSVLLPSQISNIESAHSYKRSQLVLRIRQMSWDHKSITRVLCISAIMIYARFYNKSGITISVLKVTGVMHFVMLRPNFGCTLSLNILFITEESNRIAEKYKDVKATLIRHGNLCTICNSHFARK